MTTKEGKLHVIHPDTASPKQILAQALDRADEFEQCVFIGIDKDGDLQRSWSQGGIWRAIGLCEGAKQEMLDSMRVGEDD